MDNVITKTYTDVFPMKIWLKISLLAAAFVFAYIPAVSLLVGTWLSRDDSSHGFLVPFISLYFVWAKKRKAAANPNHAKY